MRSWSQILSALVINNETPQTWPINERKLSSLTNQRLLTCTVQIFDKPSQSEPLGHIVYAIRIGIAGIRRGFPIETECPPLLCSYLDRCTVFRQLLHGRGSSAPLTVCGFQVKHGYFSIENDLGRVTIHVKMK